VIGRSIRATVSVLVVGSLFVMSWAAIIAALTGTSLSLLPTSRVSIASLIALVFVYAAGPIMIIAGAIWLIRRANGTKR
jgi:hypothetical protein